MMPAAEQRRIFKEDQQWRETKQRKRHLSSFFDSTNIEGSSAQVLEQCCVSDRWGQRRLQDPRSDSQELQDRMLEEKLAWAALG